MTHKPPTYLARSVTHSGEDTEVEARIDGGKLFFFRPETAEILVCDSGKAAEAVRSEAALLEGKLDALRGACGELARALKSFEDARRNRRIAEENAVKTALAKEQQRREELLAQFKALAPDNRGGELMELLPLANSKTGQPLLGGKKFTYVRSSKIKNHLRGYKLSGADEPEMKSFLAWQQGKGWQLDRRKFDKAISAIKPKISLQENTQGLWLPETWSPGFVTGFNDGMKLGDPEDERSPDKMIAFSGEASLLRFFGGASRSASSNISADAFRQALRGEGVISAEYKLRGAVGLDLANGKITADLHLPRRSGLEVWIPAPEKNLTLGHFRLKVKGDLHGACGASLLGEGGAQFELARDGSKQGLKGSKDKRTVAGVLFPRLNARNGTTEARAEAGAELTAFAGAQGGASINGAFEWQQPESTEFAVFASIQPTLTAQAGAGGSASFYITYEGGLFRIKVKLGACVGAGLEGEVAASVGAGEILQFAWWVKTQIANSGEQYLDYFQDDAFKIFTWLQALSIIEGNEKFEEYLGLDPFELEIKLLEWEGRDNALASRVASANADLINSTAEVKGLLLRKLYEVGRHYPEETSRFNPLRPGSFPIRPNLPAWKKPNEQPRLWSDFLKDKIDWNWPTPDLLPDRNDFLDLLRDGIRNILSSTYLEAELNNVFQHAHADGTKLGNSEMKIIENWAQRISGIDIGTLRDQLKTTPTPGYKLCRNDSPEYKLKDGIQLAWKRDTLVAPTDDQFA